MALRRPCCLLQAHPRWRPGSQGQPLQGREGGRATAGRQDSQGPILILLEPNVPHTKGSYSSDTTSHHTQRAGVPTQIADLPWL